MLMRKNVGRRFGETGEQNWKVRMIEVSNDQYAFIYNRWFRKKVDHNERWMEVVG